MRLPTEEELKLSDIIHDKTRPEEEREEAKRRLKEIWESLRIPGFA